MRELPKAYEIYKHFKGNLYQILAIATDSEDGRQMVVYQALYGDFCIYVRALDSFMSETDFEKYPEAKQKFRFECVEKNETGEEQNLTNPSVCIKEPEHKEENNHIVEKVVEKDAEEMPDLDPAVIAYLDARGYEERLNILAGVHHRITDDMLTTMAMVSDIELEEGSVEERYQSLKNCLITKQRFEIVRHS